MNIRTFKFLTDENIDFDLLNYLRNEGLDVFDIKEERLYSLTDRDILNFANQDERIVISQDSDFGALIFRDSIPFYGVIYLRPGHENPSIHIQTFKDILELNIDFTSPFILVAENLGYSVKMRYRAFSL